ncbi:MAG: tetratricopeptide repeat protein [Gammaproteobacteria bacterium]|nr:tetratricopeptide repeat protein [Gammaproteobacteria bacterium]
MQSKICSILSLLLLNFCVVLLSSCSIPVKDASTEELTEREPEEELRPENLGVFKRNNEGNSSTGEEDATSVVSTLVQDAEFYVRHGELGKATATLERGLRISPNDPVLWHHLARIKLMEKNYSQAEQFAMKSNRLLKHKDFALREKNDSIIDQAKGH